MELRFLITTANRISDITVGCVDVEITAVISTKILSMIRGCAILLLVISGIAVLVASWHNNMDPDEVMLYTPGLADLFSCLQFFVYTGALSLPYPGFYQPVAAALAWSALYSHRIFSKSHNIADPAETGNVYCLWSWSPGLQRPQQAIGMHLELGWSKYGVLMSMFWVVVVSLLAAGAVQMWYDFVPGMVIPRSRYNFRLWLFIGMFHRNHYLENIPAFSHLTYFKHNRRITPSIVHVFYAAICYMVDGLRDTCTHHIGAHTCCLPGYRFVL
jgi:hypothetical protein